MVRQYQEVKERERMATEQEGQRRLALERKQQQMTATLEIERFRERVRVTECLHGHLAKVRVVVLEYAQLYIKRLIILNCELENSTIRLLMAQVCTVVI